MSNPTEMIKSKFSNKVHKLLEPNIELKRSDRWKHKKNYELTDSQKLAIFNQIVELHTECSNELISYQFDKREKRRIQKARIGRGILPKKKTTKKEYEKNLQKDLVEVN